MEPSDWMDQPFISYAQNYEDVMLWRALRHIERGFYIDIGAWSPDLDSVTRAFSEREWRGINIEPDPYYFAQLTERRPNDINLRLAIGAHSGTTAMYFIPQSGLSTAAEKLVIDYRAKGWELREEVVELSTLAEVCSAYVASGLDIHFLKIDVEGLERDVLAGNDWSRFRPWIVIVEAMLPNSQIECHGEWDDIITSAGYQFVYADGLNRYYVAPEHPELAAAFRFPPNRFDLFIPATLASALEDLSRSSADLNSAIQRAECCESCRDEAQRRLATAERVLQESQKRVAATERLLEESQKRVESQEGDLIASRQRESDLRNAKAEAARRANTAEADLRERQNITAQYEALLKSTSWRWTAPLRMLAALVPDAIRGRLH
jgi:FkbM family methyltransferase